VYSTSLAERNKSDSELLTELLSSVSPESKSAILLHSDYDAYTNAPRHKRSLKFYLLMHSLHRVGDASIKHRRTAALIHGSQGTRSFEEWVDWLNTNFEQFIADFEDPENRGYISCAELKSFLFLHGTDRTRYRVVYDEHLRGNASGRFPNTDALIRAFQAYDNSQKMSVSEPTSVQANAYVAAAHTQPQQVSEEEQPPAKHSSGGRRLRANKTPCPHCLAAKGHTNFGHSATTCSNNPVNIANQKQFAEKNSTTQKQAFVASDDRFDKLETAVSSITMFLSSLQLDSPSAASASTDNPQLGAPLAAADDRMDKLERAVASILDTISKL